MVGITVTPIQTTAGTGANVTSLLTLTSGNYASGATVQLIRPQLLFTGLNGAAATITVKIRNITDGLTIYRESVAKDIATDTGIRFTLPPFLTTANKTYGIQVLSSNASDTNASWQIDWLDANIITVPVTQKVDVDTIKTQAVTCAAGVTVSPYVGNADGVTSRQTIDAGSSAHYQAISAAGRTGYRSDAVVLVANGVTDVLRGTALLAAYAAAKILTPGGNALSATNRAAVLILSGRYDLVTGDGNNHGLLLDTEFVDLFGLSGVPDDVFVTSQIVTASRGTVEQTASDVRMSGFTLDLNCNRTNAGVAADPAAYWPSSDRSLTVGNNVKFRTSGTGGWSMKITVYSGTFTDCTGGVYAFGGEGIASGTFLRCVGGDWAFGGNGVAAGYFVDCTGGVGSFGGGLLKTSSGTFIRCAGGSGSFQVPGTGKYKDCLRYGVLKDNLGVNFSAVLGTAIPAESVTGRDAAALGKLLDVATPANTVNDLATAANQTTILNRLGAWTGTGLNTLLGAFRALVGKKAALTPTDLTADSVGFDNTTDSLEAVRDRGDSAWLTAAGFATETKQDAAKTVIDTVAIDVAGLDGAAMRGTDGAYMGTPPAAATIAGAVLDEVKGTHTGHLASIPTNPYTGTPPTVIEIDTRLSGSHGNGAWDATDVGLSDQQIANALQLAPAGTPAANSAMADLIAILAQANLITSGAISVVNPITRGGHLDLYRGASYSQALGNSIPATDTGTTWPVLNGEGTTLELRFLPVTLTGGLPMTSATPTVTAAQTASGARSVLCELTDVHTLALVAGTNNYVAELWAVLSSGSVPLVVWTVSVKEGRP